MAITSPKAHGHTSSHTHDDDRVLSQGTPLHQDQLERRTVAEFFAGIGLMRLGLERRGWRIVFANDIDSHKQATYHGHFGNGESHFALGDIHLLDAHSVPSVTLATASFPCTDLSLAGGREGIHGRESSAFWGFTRVIRSLGDRRPPFILLENVTGFLTSHGGSDFQSAMSELNDLGYSVDAFVLDAQRFVPQSRQRLFVAATRDTLFARNLEEHPALDVQASRLRPQALAAFIRMHASDIRWRLRDLPPPPAITNTRLDDILEDLGPEDTFWWSPTRATKLLNQMSQKHRAIADTMIARPGWSYGTVFRRMRVDKLTGEKRSMAELRSDGIAGCLRTPKGGSAKQILFKAGNGQYFARLLTPRENARLMGADEYTLPKALDQAFFGFGDAVCVPVVEWVVGHYFDPLLKELTGHQIVAPMGQTHMQFG